MYDTKRLISFVGFVLVGIAWCFAIMEAIGIFKQIGAAATVTILWISIVVAILLVFYSMYGGEDKCNMKRKF